MFYFVTKLVASWQQFRPRDTGEDKTMGLFDFFRGKSLRKQCIDYCKAHPEWSSARTEHEMLRFLENHPGWQQLPPDVVRELVARIADQSHRWVTYDVDHAFEIVVYAAEMSGALVNNFIPICRKATAPLMRSPEWMLWMFAWTFQRHAGQAVFQTTLNRQHTSNAELAHAYETGKLCAEASLICDRYNLATFIPCAWAWLLKGGDFTKAIAILDEGIEWSRRMGTTRPHRASAVDEKYIIDMKVQVQSLEQSKLNLRRLEQAGIRGVVLAHLFHRPKRCDVVLV